jgi:hypothetical protein
MTAPPFPPTSYLASDNVQYHLEARDLSSGGGPEEGLPRPRQYSSKMRLLSLGGRPGFKKSRSSPIQKAVQTPLAPKLQ